MNSWDKFYDVNIEDLDKHDLGKYDFDTDIEIDSDSDDDNYDNDLTGVVTRILDKNDDEMDDYDLNNLELTTS